MEHDVTLFGMDYRIGSTGKEYFRDLTTLVDVLGGYPGSKAIVLFSEATAIGAMNDLWFNDVAMHAAVAQAAFYPANPVMLQSRGVSEGLARLANQSGGRMGFFDGDMSIPYRQAQRDMSCRYTVGAYLDDEQGRQRKEIKLNVTREGLHIRHPEMIKLFTDEEKLANRQRAAFVDPGPYENPLVRMFAFPAHPATATRWDTLIGLSFPAPVGEGGNDISIKGELKKAVNKTRIDKYDATFHIDPPEGGGDTRPVTILGDTKLKEGGYIFTAVLREEDGDEIVAADTQIQVPPVFSDLVILRGPIFARVVPGGKLFRADAKEKIEDTKLDQILGGDKSIEPMLVNEVDAGEEFLAYWNACVQGKVKLTGPAVVKRRVYTEEGELVVELDEIPLNLENVGKKLFCHDAMSVVPANSLEPGEYEVDVLITYTNGDRISHGSAPLHVK